MKTFSSTFNKFDKNYFLLKFLICLDQGNNREGYMGENVTNTKR